MAKNRKTREQKKLADSRHISYHKTSSPTYQISPQSKLPQAPTQPTNSYPYLVKDLSKTAIMTFSIVAVQIILFYMLTNRLINIPGLSY